MKRLDFYKCEVCGNLVQTFVVGGGELTCCNQPMTKLDANSKEDAMLEKHVPIFVKSENGDDEVRVGEILHPMMPEHYIMFIETISNDQKDVQIKFLQPGEEPKMILHDKSDGMSAFEFCNIHGLWEGKSD